MLKFPVAIYKNKKHMDKRNITSGRPKSTGPKPPKTCSMYDFQNPPFMPPAPGYFPYMMSPWPVDMVYMDLARRLAEERGQRPEGRGSGGGRRKEKRGSARSQQGWNRPGTPDPRGLRPCRLPVYQPQFYQPQFYQPQYYQSHQMHEDRGHWERPPVEESSSDETLTPCNSCRCCRYFAESQSMLEIVGRARCGRKYVNEQLFDRKCDQARTRAERCGHCCEHAEELPVRDRAKSKARKGGKGGKTRHGARQVETGPERDEGDGDDPQIAGRFDFRGSGDDRAPQMQTLPEKKETRDNCSYFLGM